MQYILIVTVVLTNFSDIISLIKESIQNMTSFTNLLIPIMMTLIITTGSVTTATIIQPILVFMISLIGNFINNIAIPIVIMVANSTLMVLTIVSRKRYMRYAMYHMLTFLFSMIQLILLFCGVLENKVLTIVASGIAGLSLLLTVILCGKAMWEETKKRLHM